MLYKEREIELKSEYEDLLSMAKAAKREQDEKLAELDARIRDAKFASERAEAEYARFSAVREDFRNSARQYAEKLAGLANLDVERMREEAKREVRKKCMEDLSLYKSEILESRSVKSTPRPAGYSWIPCSAWSRSSRSPQRSRW